MYQLMLLPEEVAFSCEVPPEQMFVGEAVTGVGAARGATVTVTGVRVAEVHNAPEAFHVRIIWPLPDLNPDVCTMPDEPDGVQ